MKLFLLVIVVISFFLVLGGAYSLYKHQYEEGTGGCLLSLLFQHQSVWEPTNYTHTLQIHQQVPKRSRVLVITIA